LAVHGARKMIAASSRFHRFIAVSFWNASSPGAGSITGRSNARRSHGCHILAALKA
jgi:hypothetical protein